MAKVLVTEDYLSDIGDAIRGKLGGSTHYTPGQMASAISSIPTVDPTLISKSISANGTYNADDDNADGYSSVSVNVPNSYSAQDEGKVVSSGALVAQESQNVSQNGTYDTTLKNQVVVAVPNSYSASDEGKVVSSGELVAQTSRNVTENGTYDTTENNEVVVNVQGGGGSTLISKSITQNGTYNPSDDNADGYSQVTVNVSGGDTEILLNAWEYKSTSGGTFTFEREVTIPTTGTYFVSASAYSSTLSVLVNDVSQSLDFEYAGGYIRYFTKTLNLQADDVIKISVSSSGRSAAFAQVIKVTGSSVV